MSEGPASPERRGLAGWAIPAPPVDGSEPLQPVRSTLNEPPRRRSRRSTWWLGGGLVATAAVIALVLALTGVFSGTERTRIGATVHVVDKNDYIDRAADIVMNSVKVASDGSLCDIPTANTLGYWLVVDMTVTNTSDERYPMNPGGFEVKDSEGNDAKIVMNTPDDCFPADNHLGAFIAPGDTQEVRLAIDTNSPSGTLIYDPVVQDHPVSWAYPNG